MSTPSEPDFAAQFADIPDALSAFAKPPQLRLPELPAAPERTRVQKRRLTALVGSLGWLLGHLGIYGIRSDLERLSLLYVAAQVLLPFAFAAGSLTIAMSSGRLGLGVRVALVSAVAILGPLAFGLIALGAPAPRLLDDDAHSLLGVLVCFDITVAWLAVPLLCAAFALHGAFAAGAVWRSALVGSAIGLFAGATMNLHCPNVAPLHMFLGHGLPALVAALAGALLLSRRART